MGVTAATHCHQNMITWPARRGWGQSMYWPIAMHYTAHYSHYSALHSAASAAGAGVGLWWTVVDSGDGSALKHFTRIPASLGFPEPHWAFLVKFIFIINI